MAMVPAEKSSHAHQRTLPVVRLCSNISALEHVKHIHAYDFWCSLSVPVHSDHPCIPQADF